MPGIGRPSVSLAAYILKKAGIIDYMHGTVKILNRKSLESDGLRVLRRTSSSSTVTFASSE